jgi:hypothetical protein
MRLHKFWGRGWLSSVILILLPTVAGATNPFIASFTTSKVASTVPANGDVNPTE